MSLQKGLFILMGVIYGGFSFVAAADICQGNICIDPQGNIYIKDSDAVYTDLLSGDTAVFSGTATSGTILSGAITSGTVLSGSISTGSVLSDTVSSGAVSSGSVSTGSTMTGTISTGTTSTPVSPARFFPRVSKNLTPTQELEESVQRGYANELTIFNTVEDYNADQLLLREQAAKIYFQMGRVISYNGPVFDQCSFTDVESIVGDLKEFISKACGVSLMKGHEQQFRPIANLTYAEAITVIARLANIRNTTTQSARWTPYLEYVQKMGILQGMGMDSSTMDTRITRGEIMVLLYRFSQVANANGGDFSAMMGATTTPPSDPSSISVGAGIVDMPRFTNALLWMYDNEMTIHRNPTQYKPFDVITNEQVAKVLSVYDTKFVQTTADKECTLIDAAVSPLAGYITDLCKKGIIGHSSRIFRPTASTLKSEFIEMLVRMVDKDFATQTGISLQQAALDLEIISSNDLATFDKPLTRYEVALLLSDMHLRGEFIKKLNTNTTAYNVIAPVQDTSVAVTPGQQRLFIDLNSIDNKDFTHGYMTIFGKNYKIAKKETSYYFPTSYTWFGDVLNVEDDSVIGTISLSILQQGGMKTLVQGFISLPALEQIYTLSPTGQIPYYLLTRIK